MGTLTNGRDLQDIKNSMTAEFQNIGHQAADYASDLSEKAVSTVRKYPLHSALAAVGVGFIVGALVARK